MMHRHDSYSYRWHDDHSKDGPVKIIKPAIEYAQQPATEKQINLINKLAIELNQKHIWTDGLTSAGARATIKELLELKKSLH
jgi:hypothetical protein